MTTVAKFSDVRKNELVSLDEKYDMDKTCQNKIVDLVGKTILIYEAAVITWKDKESGEKKETVKYVFKLEESDPLFSYFMHESKTLREQYFGCEIAEGDILQAKLVERKAQKSGKKYYSFE